MMEVFMKIKDYAHSSRCVCYALTLVYFLFSPAKRKQAARRLAEAGIDKSNALIWDMFFSDLYYGVNPSIYIRLGFHRLSARGKDEFVSGAYSTQYHPRYRTSVVCEKKTINLLNSKYDTYCLLKEFYKRDCILLEHQTPKQIFEGFVQSHSAFIAKPLVGNQGKGVHIISRDTICNLDDMYKELAGGCGHVLEELIVQHPDMAKFHPQSVNTVRFLTYRKGHNVLKVGAILRMGTGNSVVDNTHNGGLGAVIDVETGIVISGALSGKNLVYIHPDSQEMIVGAKVPAWNELLSVVEKVSQVLEDSKLVGWDFAYSKENGWVLVEANGLPSLTTLQQILGKGFYHVIKKFE